MDLPIDIRPKYQDDDGFIYATWLRSYRFGSRFAKGINNTTFFREHTKIIKYILDKKTTRCLIACLSDDPKVILGYCVFEVGESPVIHYVYVKEAFRKMGIATRLAESTNLDWCKITYSHQTYFLTHMEQKISEMTYNPYRL